jgi:hypothetical protein
MIKKYRKYSPHTIANSKIISTFATAIERD